MAEAILGGNAAIDKSSFPSFNIQANLQHPRLPGLVDHPLLSPDWQATILGLVKEQNSVALGDIMAALGDHPAPAGAVLALVEAGVLQIADGLIDPDSELTLAPPPAASGARDGEAPLPDNPASSEPRKPAVAQIPVGDSQPAIFTVDGKMRSALRREKLLQRPGFYLGAWEKTCYIGMGKNVGERASSNPDLGGSDPAHRIICITDQHDHLTASQAMVAERLFTQMVAQGGELKPINDLPHGAAIEPDEYDRVRLFVADAALALRQANLLFNRLPAGALLLPPAGAPASDPLDPDAQIYAISVPGLQAHLAEHEGEWRLLRGSCVRPEVKASAFGPAAMRRAELLHSGGLLRTDQVLSLTQDLTFSSAWAASHFVLGQKPRSDLWKPVSAPTIPDQPRP